MRGLGSEGVLNERRLRGVGLGEVQFWRSEAARRVSDSSSSAERSERGVSPRSG